jgi:hypothetical protein
MPEQEGPSKSTALSIFFEWDAAKFGLQIPEMDDEHLLARIARGSLDEGLRLRPVEPDALRGRGCREIAFSVRVTDESNASGPPVDRCHPHSHPLAF